MVCLRKLILGNQGVLHIEYIRLNGRELDVLRECSICESSSGLLVRLLVCHR